MKFMHSNWKHCTHGFWLKLNQSHQIEQNNINEKETNTTDKVSVIEQTEKNFK